MVLEIWKDQEAEVNGQAQHESSWTEHFLWRQEYQQNCGKHL